MAATNQERRLRQWAVGQRDLPATTATLLQGILLRMGPRAEPCTASYATLARDVSLATSTVYGHLAQAEDEGWVKRERVDGRRSPDLTVTVRPSEAEEEALRCLWQSGVLEEPRAQEEWRGARWLHGPERGQVRWRWERALRQADLSTTTKGLGWGLALLLNSGGEPLRETTRAELAALTGLHPDTVTGKVRELEKGRWLYLERRSFRGGGLAAWLRLPDAVLNAVRARRERR